MTHNPNCDGSHCRSFTGEVRLYPLGGGGNLILCAACWARENAYRRERGRETGAAENWPTLVWQTAEIYRVGADSEQPKALLCNWCGKRHIQPAQNAREALARCLKAPDDRHLLDGVREG